MSLQARCPELGIDVLDPNPAQLDHLRAKQEALVELRDEARRRRFNVEDDDPRGLSERGNFESLFRGLRQFVYEFVLDREGWRRLFDRGSDALDVGAEVFVNRYWSVAFELFFADPLLEAMFGPAAIQHATPGSYPRYFQARFERGLARADAPDNPFLHHVFLGHYLDRAGARPRFLEAPAVPQRLRLIEGTLEAIPDLRPYDFLDLSNIFDWMDASEVARTLARVREESVPGSIVMWRQLNNAQDLERLLAPVFRFDAREQETLAKRDRSLFYATIHVGRRIR